MAIATARRNARTLAAACTLLLSLLLLPGCSPQRHYDALLVLSDIASGEGESLLKQRTPEPSRALITYTIAERTHTADLFLPANDNPEAGIVLVPGAVPDGKDNPSLVAFATTLARVRFAVLTPQLSGPRELKVRPADAREVADAFLYLAQREELAPQKRAGMAAFSYGVGPAVLAALEDDVRGRVRFIFGVGGYHDLRAAIGFLTTGYFVANGASLFLQPDEYGKLVFAKSVLDHISSRQDRLTLEAMISARLQDPGADLAAMENELGPEGLAVYRLLTNTEPAETPRLLAALPQPIVEMIDALTLDNKELQPLTARLILVHGKNDRLIPYSESLALSHAVAPSQSRAFILNRVLGHVDLTLSHFFSGQLWREELPDVWRLLHALNLLLMERERDTVANDKDVAPADISSVRRGETSAAPTHALIRAALARAAASA